MRWFTSDLHLFHNKIIEYDKRPFTSLEEMHETIITRWNAVVKSKDTVYVLGDIGFGNPKRLVPILKRLNGMIILVRGNHCRQNGFKMRKMIVDGMPMFHDYCDIKYIKMANQDVCLSHYPYNDDRFKELGPTDCGHWLIHGHTHRPAVPGSRMICVSCNVWDYTPVPETKILEIINNAK